MNEQSILNESLHEDPPQATANADGGTVPLRLKASRKTSFGDFLASFSGISRGVFLSIAKGACSALALLLLWLVVSPAQAQTTTINLSLHNKISSQSPKIGDVITYTIVVANAPGSTTATTVSVKEELPDGGVTYVPGSASTVRGTGTYAADTGIWSIASIAPGDSVALTLSATVNQPGVWFNKAEVVSAGQTDLNSTPNNQSLTEDDYDTVCFSIPILWYPGDEYTVTIPSGYDNITWYRNDVPISTSAVSTSLAEVNSDFSLTIKSVGTYRFMTFRTGCPATNCCDIQVIPGLYGSLGNFVFNDLNKDGAQTPGEPGIDNVRAYLYDQSGKVKLDSTVTAGGGKYLFDSLTDGSYVVRFLAPTGFQSTTANVAGVTSDLNSDAGVGGFTGVYTIDTSQPTSSTARNNLTVDAGFYGQSTGLGDFVFMDLNKNGIQDAGESGLGGVKVTLYVNDVVSVNTTTDTSGLYSFAGLASGSSKNYSVAFTAPKGYTATLANIGGNDAQDSDVDPVTGKTQSVTLASGEFNTSLDAGFYPSCPTDFTLVVSGDATICSGEKAVLTASTMVSYVRWYLTPTGGTAFDTLNISRQSSTVYPTQSTTYYAEAVTLDGGCVSPRKPVTITVTTVTAPIIQANVQNTCPATTVDLTKVDIGNRDTGTTYEWYTSLNRSASTMVTNLTAVGTGQYYLFAKSGDCYSAPAVLTVGIVDCNCQTVAGVDVGPGITVCAADVIPLKAVLSGSATSVVWATNGTGTFSDPTSLTTTYTPSTADITTGNVLLTATTNDPDGPGGICQSVTSSLIAKINTRPVAPVNLASEDTQICLGSSTKLSGLAPGSQINWYDQDGKLIGTTPSEGKLVVTPTQAGAVVYSAESFTDAGCVSARTSLTITVGACLTDLAVVKTVVTPGPYSVGQKITYAITATNNGPTTANGVNVSDVLPASLTYVSSTPAGEYSYATGSWTIGTLTAGSDRTLLVDAIVITAGSTKSTAIIHSPENDPAHSENDTSSVTIDIKACAVQPPTILCAIPEICRGGTTMLSANGCVDGTVKWSDGKTGLRIFSTPNITTTYTASCIVGNCVSTASNAINVVVLDPKVPTITASSDNVCPGASVTLTASGCAGGIIEWSDKAQTGTSIVVTPYTRTTYTAQCLLGSCLSNPATKTIGIVTDGPAPTIAYNTTVVCPGESVILTVENCLGTPVWNSTTAATGSIVVTPTPGNNSYSVYCKDGACASKSSPVYTISIVAPVIPTITASADTVCAKGAVILTAADCNGTVVWNVSGQTGPSITVYPTASISYFAQCKYRSCLSAQSNTVTITVATPATPIISVSSTTLCSGNKLTLTAKGCAGTVQWHGVDKMGASIEIYPTGTLEYYATCKQGTCESEASNKVRVTVSSSTAPAPIVTASTLDACSGGLVSLTATGCAGGTVKWSDGQTGAVVSVTATTTNHEFYALCQVGTQCGTGKSNVISINVTPTSTPSIVRCLCSADTICPGEQVKLSVKNCQGTPTWSNGETTASIVVSPTVTTGYSVYCQDGVCKSPSTQPYTITVIPIATPIITASATVVEPGGTVTLSASGCAGTVIWSAIDINGNNKGVSIVVRPAGTQAYYAQCQFRECLSDPSATIVVNPGTSVNCSADGGLFYPALVINKGGGWKVCAGSSSTIVVSGTSQGMVIPDGYSVVYLMRQANGGIISQISTTPEFIISGSIESIQALVYNGNPTDKNYLDLSLIKLGITTSADVKLLIANKCASLGVMVGSGIYVTRIDPPVLSGGSSFTVCNGSLGSLTATGCVGGTINWSDGTVGATYSKPIDSDRTLTATCTIDGCTSKPSAGLKITVAAPDIPIIVSNAPTACVSETLSLTATGCAGGTYLWSDNKTVGSTLTITPTADVSYRVRCKLGECLGDWSAYTTIKVGAPAAPTISLIGSTPGMIACSGTPITLVAAGCSPNSSVVWSNEQVGPSITVSLTSSTTFTAQCYTAGSCKSAPSNPIAITVMPKVPQPVVVDKTNACPLLTVDLASAVTSITVTTGGVLEYYTDATLSSASKVANSAAVGTGTYYVVQKTANGCMSLPAAIHVLVNTCVDPTPCDTKNPATANAGADVSICVAKTYQLKGSMGGAGKTAHWTTSGNGFFDNSYALNATYTASAEDILSGKVTLTLSVSTNNAACPVAKDDMILTIDGIKSVPAITVVGGTKLCFGDSVTLKAPEGAANYKWSNNATTPSIVVKTSGAYTVQLFDTKGCSSAKADSVTVTVAEPVQTLVVSNLRNECPAKIVDLTKAVLSPRAGSSYTYRICECTTSNLVSRPDSVSGGNYWVVERNASGCLSAPAKVVVKVFNCATDTLTTDVSIAKLASTAFVKTGAPVTYTITVSNAGPHTAHNIDVRDILPKGLDLLPAPTASYKVSNGVITKRIDSLKAGQSEQIVFTARVTTKGEKVVNKAEITYLDNKDTNLANNTSSVTVTDTSTRRTSRIGLAKAVLGKPVAVGDSLIKVSYSFLVTNFGEDTLHTVKVTDDLAYAFSPNKIQSTKITLANGSTLKANAAFTGQVPNFQLLDTLSTILPGASQTFRLDVTVKRTAGDTIMTFKNIANASAMNSLTLVTDMSTNGGDTDPDNDGDPTNNMGFSTFTLIPPQAQSPSLGLALAVVKVEPLSDSSYNVTYKATLKNVGNVDLEGIVLTDSLVRVFTSPASYSVIGTPVVGTGSTLVANVGFNGNTKPTILTSASKLAVGVQDTVLITVNVKPNGNNGPFYSSATVVGHTVDSSQVVKDISNNGIDPSPAGSVSTTVRFDLPKGLLGVAKSVGTPTLVQEGIYDIPYTILLSNMGTVPLKNVQVVDNLSQTFRHGALIVSNRVNVTSMGNITPNPLYTGQGTVTKMLIDSISTLAVGAKSLLSFTVRVDVKNADSLTFSNVADATALTPTNEVVNDRSTTGINNDPDNDLDPRNNNTPTPVVLNGLSTSSYIGLAMSVRDTVRQTDGSFNVTYQIVVKNYGSENLKNVSITDTLSKVFNSQTGSTFNLVRAPFTTSTGSALKLNPNYNGGSDPILVLGDSTSTLAAGKVDTLQMVVNVASSGTMTTFLNSAYAEGLAISGKVSDVSTSGLNPDLNGNNNPTDSNEREATALNLPQTFLSIFIPEGFSPNGDGINDLFVIRGTAGLTVSLEVYNRWGHMVYKNDEYRNDWDGKPNQGISISSDSNGVPDGTYYYVINTSDGRKFVRYMTINR